MHDCDEAEFVNIGTLPSGGACIINRLVMDADLVVAEGFIEPHFFAGYSGSRKSILPGLYVYLLNHCSAFIASPAARTGILEGNPIHADMVWAARAARLAFVVNAVINEKKEAVYVVAGDMEKAHEAGCKFLIRPVRCGGQTCGHCGYHKWWIPARPEHLSGGQGYDRRGSDGEGRRG